MEQIGKKKFNVIALLFPALSIYLIFVIIPLIVSFNYSFFQWDGVNQKIFIGLRNYIDLLNDEVFHLTIKNTFIIVFAALFIQVPLSFILAELLNRKLKGTEFFKSIYFIPAIMSTIIVALMWSFILNPQNGLINTALRAMGLEKFALGWIGNKHLSIISVALVNVWQFVGVTMVILLAGLKGIPEEIHHVCKVDGAKGLVKVFKVTIPLVWEPLKTCIVLSTVGSLKIFDLVYALTNGGPGHSSDVMATYMYKEAFNGLRYGYGITISVVIFIIGLIFSVSFLKVSQKEVV